VLHLYNNTLGGVVAEEQPNLDYNYWVKHLANLRQSQDLEEKFLVGNIGREPKNAGELTTYGGGASARLESELAPPFSILEKMARQQLIELVRDGNNRYVTLLPGLIKAAKNLR
jgi:hypothetical protein